MCISEKDLYWLAGLLEGEGSFLESPPSKPNRISIQLEMTDEDIVKKAADLLMVPVYKPKKRNDKHKQTFRLKVNCAKAAEWMILLKPLMGIRRQSQIDCALNDYNPKIYSFVMPSYEVLLEMHKTLSLREIAKELGCSHHTVFKRLKYGGIV